MNPIAHLIIYRIPDLAAPYAGLSRLAARTGLTAGYLPTPPSPFRAWQKAVRVPRQRLIAPANLVEQVQAEHGCAPAIHAETVSVNDRTRHVVRFVTIGGAQSRNRQLDAMPVAVLKFGDGLTPGERFVSEYPHDDPLRAVNGNVDALIYRMRLEYQRQLETADSQDIRACLRRYLSDLRAVLLTDGVYLAPVSVADTLTRLQAFICGLAEWQREAGPMCQVYPVIDELADSTRSQVEAALLDHFEAVLRGIRSDASRGDGRGLAATAARLRRIDARLAETLGTMQEFGPSADSGRGGFDLAGLDGLVDEARRAIETAL